MAVLAVHGKKAKDNAFLRLLPIIREHNLRLVKKAVRRINNHIFRDTIRLVQLEHPKLLSSYFKLSHVSHILIDSSRGSIEG